MVITASGSQRLKLCAWLLSAGALLLTAAALAGELAGRMSAQIADIRLRGVKL